MDRALSCQSCFSSPAHTFSPAQTIDDKRQSAATFGPGRQVCLTGATRFCQPPDRGREPGAVAVTQGLPVRPWFERLMPTPFQALDEPLATDPDTWDILQDPVRSVIFYREQLALRQEKEAKGEEYCFAPLQITLENMRRLTAHILAGRQFREPLTQEETDAFLKLQTQIEDLIAHKAPYRRTVQLAFVMSVLQELMVARHVIGSLRETQPKMFARRRCVQSEFLHENHEGQLRPRTTASIPLQEVFACRFGDLFPEGAPLARASVLGEYNAEAAELLAFLDMPSLLLYPSFDALDPDNFCRFGHLGVYPLGMMTAHALNADGFMRTPLDFFNHDLIHMSLNASWKFLDESHPLVGVTGRLYFRQLALDCLPEALRRQQIEKALVLVLFYLFHETGVSSAKGLMASSSVLPLWQRLCEERREERYNYPLSYHQVTDIQALLACLWACRVHDHCKAYVAGQQLAVPEAEVNDFVGRGLPALLEHWAFFETHRDALHSWFLSKSEKWRSPRPDRGPTFMYQGQSRYAAACPPSGLMLLQTEKDPDAEGLVCHTDLIYFDTLLADGGHKQIASALGKAPPDKDLRFLFETAAAQDH